MCGEQLSLLAKTQLGPGSSPRVRGTEIRHHEKRPGVRFIPACAGNSARTTGDQAQSTVHPRVCGEQRHERLPDGFDFGSSPRVRGTDCCRDFRDIIERFIPACACAGNRQQPQLQSQSKTVHPRVCGEQGARCPYIFRLAGSSPRVRGTDESVECFHCELRFIPACAGNRAVFDEEPSPQSVHPRVCGEQSERFREIDSRCGSSPRVRGTGLRSRLDPQPARFIPACAGNRPKAR